MKMRTFALLVGTIFLALPAQAGNPSFAILIDQACYQACQPEVEAYRDALVAEGLDAYVAAGEWATPEEVLKHLRTNYTQRALEGAVLIGDIPIAMINRAQHMTSAFKMSQDPDDLFNTTVPSDRFYDDFDLQFDYLSRQDTLGARYFFYNLSGQGAQEIGCEIYTGRIKPTLDGEAGYEQVRNYLRKAVERKRHTAPVGRIVSYTGEGSFSNSLVAWKDETVTLQEQFPQVFDSADGIKFYLFNMYPFVKDVLLKELKQPLDLILFHEHGVPHRQYISDIPPANDIDEYYQLARYRLRDQVTQRQRYYKETKEEAIAYLLETFGLGPEWLADLDSDSIHAADSLYDLHTGIILEEVHALNPDPLIALFDACYNGDFREKDCIGNSYIFGSGRCLVSLANTVNVLQDKSSSDLLGLLNVGCRVGHVMQMTNILESHILGDPTLWFSPVGETPDFHSQDISYWLSLVGGEAPCDVQGLALRKLFYLEYPGLSNLLLETYRTSPYYMLRWQCVHLMAYYASGQYATLLAESVDDPYEFTRRKSLFFAGRVGDQSLLQPVLDQYFSDYMSKRVVFNIAYQSSCFADSTFLQAFVKAVDQSDWIFDKEAFKQDRVPALASAISTRENTCNAVVGEKATPRSANLYLNGLRNTPYPSVAERLIQTAGDQSRDLSMRIGVVEALGWFVRYAHKDRIIEACREMLTRESDPALRDELHKTINRLTAYSRP